MRKNNTKSTNQQASHLQRQKRGHQGQRFLCIERYVGVLVHAKNFRIICKFNYNDLNKVCTCDANRIIPVAGSASKYSMTSANDPAFGAM